MPAKALMLQGTGSDVGKSLIVAGLARACTRRGLKVLPFKPQNMSNNAAVTADGGEIGRAQALQARACGVPASVHMNPVLLKPQSEIGAQVVVQGHVVGNARAQDYQGWKAHLLAAVMESFTRLKSEADLVLVEGAGSASEINLRTNDIANMGFARAADVPVVLVGDIDRGGVIAQIVGTCAVIDADDRAMLRGFLINKFRGDAALFADGLREITRRTGLPSFGLVPFFREAHRLPAEDAMALDGASYDSTCSSPGAQVTIAVPVLPRISNFDDLDPLRLEPGVRLVLVRSGKPIPREASVVLLPGSKATLADLAELRREGWDVDIAAHVRGGGRVLGICGGYQMLGRSLADPDGIEGTPGELQGLGLLDVTTRMGGDKRLAEVHGRGHGDGAAFCGYEMHIGVTEGPDRARPLLQFADGRTDGAVSSDDRVAGCYVHGLFASDAFRAAWLGKMGVPPSSIAYEAMLERTLDALADHLEAHADIDGLLALAR
jgi:adenosylcobyric acid synthase